jgi:hypothetical protein
MSMHVDERGGSGIEDRLLTDIAIALERIGILGDWVTDEGDGRSTYVVESGGAVLHVHVDLVEDHTVKVTSTVGNGPQPELTGGA